MVLGRSASDSRITVAAKQPTYVDVFYRRTSENHNGKWHDGTCGTRVSGDVPKISDILAAKPTIRKPVRALVSTAKTILADTIKEEQTNMQADKVLTANVVPKKFPVQAHQFQYPESAKKGANNPLYATTAQAHGKEMPMQHQISDRYFPSTGVFTKGFVETKPRYTGLNCAPSLSKFHAELDMRS